MNRGREVMDGAAGDVGKGRINIREKEKGGFSFLHSSRLDNSRGAKVETDERFFFLPLLSPPLPLRWLCTFFF